MRDQEKPPGNARIAVALLDVLTAAGDTAGRVRAERVLGDVSRLPRRRADWMRPELLEELFRSVPVDAQRARQIGRQLAQPSGIGLFLCNTGIATPEKAYRRADSLLARERRGDRYETVSVGPGRACVEFRPAAPEARDNHFCALLCALRGGMLEALPTAYGLLPARVRETRCAFRGAPRCRFEVAWRSAPHSGLVAGSALGMASGSLLALVLGIGGGAYLLCLLIACAVAGAAVGRSVDQARQLRAIAQGGLGRLALLDQMDRVLGEKMDRLAKLERGEAGSVGPPAAPLGAPADLAAIVRSGVSAALRHGAADGPGVDLRIEVERAPVRCHPAEIEQVVIQLVSNASSTSAASTEAGAPGGRVGVALRAVPDGFELEVSDEGGSLDPAELDRIFDPFSEPAAGAEASSPGARLASCSRVVERHGGVLSVRSEPGGATRVAVLLPEDHSQV